MHPKCAWRPVSARTRRENAPPDSLEGVAGAASRLGDTGKGGEEKGVSKYVSK